LLDDVVEDSIGSGLYTKQEWIDKGKDYVKMAVSLEAAYKKAIKPVKPKKEKPVKVTDAD
jgi:hypothetical protein